MPAAYMVCALRAKIGASFVADWVRVGCQSCNQKFGLWPFFKKTKKKYAHNFENFFSFLKIYGKEE
jgi:hypothetical protein